MAATPTEPAKGRRSDQVAKTIVIGILLAVGSELLIPGTAGKVVAWIFLLGVIGSLVYLRFGTSKPPSSEPLSDEAKVLRLILLLILAGALVFGALKLRDSVNSETNEFEEGLGSASVTRAV